MFIILIGSQLYKFRLELLHHRNERLVHRLNNHEIIKT